ncbi:MAG: hypothetical protein ACK4WF_02850 [Candidatus Brocadiales bacterium]
MIVFVDRGFDFLVLIFASLALSFMLKARGSLKANLLRRGRLFLGLVIATEILEDVVEIPIFGFMEALDDEDAIALEVITICQALTAMYYIPKTKGEDAEGYLDFSILCTIWLMIAYMLEAGLGFVFLE